MDLSNIPLPELQELQKQLPQVIARRAKEEYEAVRLALEEMAAKHGFTLADFTKPQKATRKVSSTIYQHPSDPSITWTGHGRKPGWVQNHLSAGGELEQLKVR